MSNTVSNSVSRGTEPLPAFEYLGRLFQPYSTQDGCEWIIDYIGDHSGFRKFVQSESTRFNFAGYDHTAFYKAATRVGASRHNIFLYEGWEVMPCNSYLLAFRQI